MRTFQSLHRNVDVGDKLKFRGYLFQTDDAKLGALAERNCAKNPHLYWELGAESTTEVPRNVKVLRGTRGVEAQEGASV